MILYDFMCECGEQFEALAQSGAVEEACPACGRQAPRVMSAPHVGVLLGDPVRTAAALKKRSHEHSVSQAKKNAEKIASSLGAVARAQNRWNLRSQKSSS